MLKILLPFSVKMVIVYAGYVDIHVLLNGIAPPSGNIYGIWYNGYDHMKMPSYLSSPSSNAKPADCLLKLLLI